MYNYPFIFNYNLQCQHLLTLTDWNIYEQLGVCSGNKVKGVISRVFIFEDVLYCHCCDDRLNNTKVLKQKIFVCSGVLIYCDTFSGQHRHLFSHKVHSRAHLLKFAVKVFLLFHAGLAACLESGQYRMLHRKCFFSCDGQFTLFSYPKE